MKVRASLAGSQLDTPVAIFLFRRCDTLPRIMSVLAQVRPTRLYIVGDGPRDASEVEEVAQAREMVESAVSWPCEVIRDYADSNRGVYENIAGGARRVFSREESAIFLEDDNLPEPGFFRFCEEMLSMYRDDERVLWVCGTNYLEEYVPEDAASYVFTKHLMPCGWASWADKFLLYYDGDMSILDDAGALKRLKHQYTNASLFRQQVNNGRAERWRWVNRGQYGSWDHQMALSIRANSMYGICPNKNQVVNIGVDAFSTHGAASFAGVMTRRFCGMGSRSLEFPLRHPRYVLPDAGFERAVDKVILLPLRLRISAVIVSALKVVLGMSKFEPFGVRGRRRSVRRSKLH